MQRFDTPFRRLCFIGMIIGLVVLMISLAVWNVHHRWFYWSSWFREHTFFAVIGLALTVGGFFGSFAPRFAAGVYQGTVGRISNWVRTGAIDVERPPEFDARHESGGSDAKLTLKEKIEWWFLPHLIVIGSPLVIVGFGAATNDASIGVLTGRTLASLLDPINLVVAVLMGLFIKRHPALISSLVVWGIALAIIVRQLNYAYGGMPTPGSVVAKIIAALMVGYAANYFAALFRRQREATRTEQGPAS